MQRTLVREGTEEFLRGQRQWLQKKKMEHAARIRALSEEPSEHLEAIAQSLLNHQDEGEYDSVWSRNIFQPLLNKTLAICSECKLVLKHPVRFANSPSIDVSPAALPSQHEHIVFAGQGTFAFCNYWAKIFSAAIYEVGNQFDTDWSPEKILACLKGSRIIRDAALLALRYARTGSLVGFGKLEQPEHLLLGRTLLVNAMELFAIAHEVGHFFCYEEHPETDGLASGQSPKDLELECDALALAVCTGYGQSEDNAFAFQLTGPLLFFCALRICDQAAAQLVGEHGIETSNSHPTHLERIQFIQEFLKKVGAAPHVIDGAQFVLEVAAIIESQVQLLWSELAENADEEGGQPSILEPRSQP
ncbi:hypothetical protein [Ralstonia solanacearum]|uniref:hypothetical protein n=1 Tax=Ralstonia solanacearum TaxID=305 RepID=UPI001867A145|nr:hypothetical protein [Ralstonia solanacearum]QOK81198.1 hypothetical protein HF906_02890 [Ralstonia solanacearum]